MNADLKTELQAILHAFREGNAGNDPDHALVQGALEFMQLFETASDAKTRLFNEAMMAISAEYPDGKDDNRRQLLLLTAIRGIDPEKSEPQLQEIAGFVEQSLAVPQETPPVDQGTKIPGAPPVGPEEQIRQLISGRQLLWLKVGQGTSDSLQIQLFADGKLFLLQQWSNYAPEVGRIAGSKDLDGAWSVTGKTGAVLLVLDGSDGSHEELEIDAGASDAVLLNGREFAIVDIDHVISL